MILFPGEFFFNEDHIRLASSHSAGDKVTYTYQFVPYIIPPKDLRLWYVPDKLKTSADHGDELPYVFGTSEVTDDMVQPYSGRFEPLMWTSIADHGVLTGAVLFIS